MNIWNIQVCDRFHLSSLRKFSPDRTPYLGNFYLKMKDLINFGGFEYSNNLINVLFVYYEIFDFTESIRFFCCEI